MLFTRRSDECSSHPVIYPPECVLLVDDKFMSELIAELQGARHPPGIIICGINMPGTNGFG